MNEYSKNEAALLKMKETWREKIFLMQEFTRLTQGLKTALDAKNIEEFEEIMQQRGQVIASLDALDAPGIEGHASGEIRQLKEQWHHLLARVWEMNQNISAGLSQGQRDLLQDLGMLRTARRADQTYLKKARQVEGYFIDKKK